MNVVGDPDRSSEIADESAESYAQRKGIRISNTSLRFNRRDSMPKATRGLTKAALQDRIEELEEENSDLREENEALGDKLDSIAELVSEEEPEEEEEEDLGEEDED